MCSLQRHPALQHFSLQHTADRHTTEPPGGVEAAVWLSGMGPRNAAAVLARLRQLAAGSRPHSSTACGSSGRACSPASLGGLPHAGEQPLASHWQLGLQQRGARLQRSRWAQVRVPPPLQTLPAAAASAACSVAGRRAGGRSAACSVGSLEPHLHVTQVAILVPCRRPLQQHRRWRRWTRSRRQPLRRWCRPARCARWQSARSG